MSSYVVQPGDSQRIADAVITYQLRQPRFALASLFAIAVFAVSGGITYGAPGAVVGALIMIALQAGVVLFKRAQLRRVMAASYRPGSTVEASFDDTSFRIATERGAGDHPYEWVADIRDVRGIVLIRLHQAHLVVALPRELVPAGTEQRVRAAAAR